MATFEELWAEAEDPSDRDNDERRDLAEHFYDRGGAAERARIRQLALDEAGKHDQANIAAGVDWREGVCAESLRDFAALLEKP